MIRFEFWLVWVAAVFAVGCSCASPAQELSTYWDGHDFQSLEAFDDIDAAEEKFDGYIDLLNQVPVEVAAESMRVFLDSAARDTVAYMVWAAWFEPYLHAKESPYRNDSLFEVWLDKVLEDGVLDDHMMRHLLQIKDVIGLNSVGRPAADVRLIDADGVEFGISDLKGQQTLLMLLDADCPSCLDYLEENLKDNRRGDVKLVAVLVNGSPMHIGNMSSRLSEDILKCWTLAWCPGREIEQGKVYDLTQIPSRILLDPECVVEKLYY